MSEKTVRIASERDLKFIHEFLFDHFHNVEPIEVSHRRKHEKLQLDDDYLMSCIKCNTTLLAFCDGILVGVLIAGTILANEHERNLEASKSMKHEKHADVLRFLSYIDEKANYCTRLDIPEALHIHIVSVHRDFRGRGIANTLFEYCIENGKYLKYQALTVDCSNYYTSKIAEQRDFSLISTVTYDEYHEYIGEKLFEPSEPHMQIKSYALLINNRNNDNEHSIFR